MNINFQHFNDSFNTLIEMTKMRIKEFWLDGSTLEFVLDDAIQ